MQAVGNWALGAWHIVWVDLLGDWQILRVWLRWSRLEQSCAAGVMSISPISPGKWFLSQEAPRVGPRIS